MTPRERALVFSGIGVSLLISLAAFFPALKPVADQADKIQKTEERRVPRCGVDAGLERCDSKFGIAWELNDGKPGAPCTCPER